MIDRLRRHLAFALLLGAALVVPAAGRAADDQAKPGQPEAAGAKADEEQGVFVESLEVNVVNVDVYVTDKEGNPIPGLTADDFEVFENGEPMKISNFYAVKDSRVVKSEAVAPEATPETPAAGEPLPAEPPSSDQPSEDQRLSLVVYVDNTNIHPHNRRRVLQDVRSFLRQKLTTKDRVMLVTYDRSLHVRESFTSDPESVVEALLKVDKLSGEAVHTDSDRRDVLQRIEDSQSGGEALSYAETYAGSLRNDLEYSIDALRDIINSLAGLPGRKAVLYVSDGLPMIAGEDIFYAVDQKFRNSGAMTALYSYDTSDQFKELAANANANRVSFYTIDAGGVRASASTSVETFGRGQAGSQTFVDSINRQNVQSTLQFLAEKTGGKAVINQNRVGNALSDIAKDFRTYYSLGYSPAHSGDGRYYEITVKLKGNHHGWRVRHRTGYRDKTPSVQMNDGVLAALRFPYSSNPLDVDLSFEPGTRRDDGNYVVPVKVRVPLRSLTLVPRGKDYAANAKLYLAALDEHGGVSDVQNTQLPISVPADEIEAARKKAFVYTFNLLLRSGEQRIAVGLRDEIAANNSFVTRSVFVGSQ